MSDEDSRSLHGTKIKLRCPSPSFPAPAAAPPRHGPAGGGYRTTIKPIKACNGLCWAAAASGHGNMPHTYAYAHNIFAYAFTRRHCLPFFKVLLDHRHFYFCETCHFTRCLRTICSPRYFLFPSTPICPSAPLEGGQKFPSLLSSLAIN